MLKHINSAIRKSRRYLTFDINFGSYSRPRGNLYHGDANGGWEKFLMIGTFVRVTLSATVIFDDQVHLFNSFLPDDGFVFPERSHRYVSFIHTFFRKHASTSTSIAISLALIWNVA